MSEASTFVPEGADKQRASSRKKPKEHTQDDEYDSYEVSGEGIEEKKSVEKEPSLKVKSSGVESLKALYRTKENEKNEDNSLNLPEENLFAVFDGVGGHGGGDVASGIAAKALKDAASRLRDLDLEQTKAELIKIANEINAGILKAGKGNNMGTTATILKIVSAEKGATHAVVLNVGDSRAYNLSNKKLSQISVDQSYSNMLLAADVKAGRIDEARAKKITAEVDNLESLDELYNKDESELTAQEKEQVENFFKGRNVIANFLGYDKFEPPQIAVIALSAGDRLLLSTDGVHDNLTTKKIEALLNSPEDAATVAKKVAAQSEEFSDSSAFRSKKDDATGLVVDIGASSKKETKQHKAETASVKVAKNIEMEKPNKAAKVAKDEKTKHTLEKTQAGLKHFGEPAVKISKEENKRKTKEAEDDIDNRIAGWQADAKKGEIEAADRAKYKEIMTELRGKLKKRGYVTSGENKVKSKEMKEDFDKRITGYQQEADVRQQAKESRAEEAQAAYVKAYKEYDPKFTKKLDNDDAIAATRPPRSLFSVFGLSKKIKELEALYNVMVKAIENRASRDDGKKIRENVARSGVKFQNEGGLPPETRKAIADSARKEEEEFIESNKDLAPK
jgi:protein phosphatase